jgi:type IV pilus assembly protein PilV
VSNSRRSDRVSASSRARGFSLIEVMVALIVLSVGLLGIARMQSLALSSTSVANKRSLAAIEAASLAAMMHENRGYWINGDPSNATITIVGTTFTFTNGAAALSAAGSPDCTSVGGPCLPTPLAAYDLHQWATTLQGMLSGDTATINCGAVTPVSCTINITWLENAVAINSQQSAQATTAQAAGTPAAIQNPSYTLYVQP